MGFTTKIYKTPVPKGHWSFEKGYLTKVIERLATKVGRFPIQNDFENTEQMSAYRSFNQLILEQQIQLSKEIGFELPESR